MNVSEKLAAELDVRDLRHIMYNKENPFLHGTIEVPRRYGNAVDALEHQCRYMQPAEAEMRSTFFSFIEKKFPEGVPVADAQGLVSEAIGCLHTFWHDFMLTYMRGTMVDLQARIDLAKGFDPVSIKEHLLNFGFNESYIDNYIMSDKYAPIEVERYEWPSQHAIREVACAVTKIE